MNSLASSAAVDAAGASADRGFFGTVFGAISTWVGAMTSNEIGIYGGLVIGLIGLIVQVHYRRKEFNLRQVEHQMRVREHEASMDRILEELNAASKPTP